MRFTGQSVTRPRGTWQVAATGVVVGMAAVACSVESRERLKHFFFEVPDNGPPSDAPADGAPTPAAHAAFGGTWPRYVVSRHRPFAERRCGVCHDAERGNAPLEDQITACTSCHTEYFRYRRYGHGPAALNQCGYCHDMHTSRWDGLLKQPESELCVSCHAAQYSKEATATYHASIEAKTCTDCHEPHYADNPGLLKPGIPGGRVAGVSAADNVEAGE